MISGFFALAAIALGYFLVLRVLANLAYPARVRMHKLGESILDDANAPEWLVESTRVSMKNGRSFRSAFWWIYAAFAILWMVVKGVVSGDNQEHRSTLTDLQKDRFDEFTTLYLLSTTAANPVVGVIGFALLTSVLLIANLVKPVNAAEVRDEAAYLVAAHSG